MCGKCTKLISLIVLTFVIFNQDHNFSKIEPSALVACPCDVFAITTNVVLPKHNNCCGGNNSLNIKLN